jgi:hypothetical protein
MFLRLASRAKKGPKMPDRYGENDDQPAGDPYEIADCEHCDDRGMRGMYACDHIDHAAAASRGMALIRREMGWTS